MIASRISIVLEASGRPFDLLALRPLSPSSGFAGASRCIGERLAESSPAAVTVKAEMELADSRHVAADVVYDARRALLADPRVQERFDELDALAEDRTEADQQLRKRFAETGTIDDGLNLLTVEKMADFSELLAATAEATEGLLDQVAVEAVLRAYREGRYRGEALAFAVPPSLPWPETGEAVKRLRGGVGADD